MGCSQSIKILPVVNMGYKIPVISTLTTPLVSPTTKIQLFQTKLVSLNISHNACLSHSFDTYETNSPIYKRANSSESFFNTIPAYKHTPRFLGGLTIRFDNDCIPYSVVKMDSYPLYKKEKNFSIVSLNTDE